MNTRPDRPPRQQAGAISTILTGLRRRVRRGSRDVIETAVSQLFDAVVGHPHGAAASGEYRIDERMTFVNPLKLREYLSAGVPVVASRVGGLPDFITHLQDGLLVPPRDAPSLAAAIPTRAKSSSPPGRSPTIA